MSTNAPASLPHKDSTSRPIGLVLGAAILVMPYLFAWATLRRGHSATARAVAFTWMTLALIYAGYLQVHPYVKEDKALAQSARHTAVPASAEQVCRDVRFTPCFVNPDGQTCRNDLDSPITRLVSNGNYSVIGKEVNSAGRCVLTLSVQGALDGNSYARTVKVWGY